MTQEEFDALDDTIPGAPPVAATGGVLAMLKAQGPVRLAAVGLLAVAGIGYGGTVLMNAGAVQVSDLEVVPAQADPTALPSFPKAPAAVAAMMPTPIQKIESVEPTQATGPVSDTDTPASEAAAAVDCTLTTTSTPLAGALIALEIDAPCDAGARADILQGDMQIAVALDEDGTSQIEIPALTASAIIAVVVEGRTPVSLIAPVSDIADYSRAVLQWQGDMGLEMHAFEGADADYGTDGHVGPEVPRNIARTLSGNGGFMMALGDASLDDANIALVYTAPAAQTVEISIEAPVTPKTCTQQIFASTIQTRPGGTPQTEDLMLTMPDCDATGGYVMLGDLEALTPEVGLASN